VVGGVELGAIGVGGAVGDGLWLVSKPAGGFDGLLGKLGLGEPLLSGLNGVEDSGGGKAFGNELSDSSFKSELSLAGAFTKPELVFEDGGGVKGISGVLPVSVDGLLGIGLKGVKDPKLGGAKLSPVDDAAGLPGDLFQNEPELLGKPALEAKASVGFIPAPGLVTEASKLLEPESETSTSSSES
jgi:hypothetical protein